MQLLDSLPQRSSDVGCPRLQAALEDIVNQVQIESNFCIRHPNYKPLELPAQSVERFQQLPSNLQDKYLSLQLRSFLYGVYYNGSLKEALAPDNDANDLALHQNLENNTFMGVDLAFYERLHASNQGKGYFDPGWQAIGEEKDGSLPVTKGGLTLHLDPSDHLPSETQSAAIGDIVSILLPKNRVQNGFYMAVGNSGPYNHDRGNGQGKTVRVYFHLSAEGAVAVMDSLTQQLNDISLPFCFKVLYNPSDYKRYDSGVLYFDSSKYEAVRSVLNSVYTEHQSHFQAEVPLFTKFIAPGLAVAEEPDRHFSEQDSFGTNRCQIVANGLLEAWQKGNESPESKMAAIVQHFSLMGIELQHSYLDANSEDIYQPLDL